MSQDLETIKQLRNELSECKAREHELKKEMIYYKSELQNSNENFQLKMRNNECAPAIYDNLLPAPKGDSARFIYSEQRKTSNTIKDPLEFTPTGK